MTLGSCLSRCAIGASLILGLAAPVAAAQASAAAGTNTNATPAASSSAPANTAQTGTGNAGNAPNAANPASGKAEQTKSAAENKPSRPPVRPSGVRNQLNPASLPPVPGGGIQLQGVPGGSVPWSIVILLTGLTLIPSLLLCVTPFARLLIVFHFLRQALGLQTTPSNQTLIGLSLILTFFLMQPVGTQIYENAVVPMQAGSITATDALQRGEVPMRKFMAHYVREKDVALFVELAKEPRPASMDDVSMRVLLPAYIVSELKAGFQIGTVLFLPFLIVDMVVASITTSVGMLQLPPVVISTPLKLLLFLMVDGWHLLIGSLMRSFN
ncbi:MAG TPA: flagellar type III secretion system pore protein FliP [Acidobacteriaceae bacterium]|nr:flagellar type III secretion system pore protein FliP [Acidobacteriaceae bacterium]